MKFESMAFNFQEIIIRHNASQLMRYLGFVDQLIIVFRRFPRFNAMQLSIFHSIIRSAVTHLIGRNYYNCLLAVICVMEICVSSSRCRVVVPFPGHSHLLFACHCYNSLPQLHEGIFNLLNSEQISYFVHFMWLYIYRYF